jgi:hypothetical protein
MILLPIEAVKPYINDYYLTFRQKSELLGFIPCSAGEDHGYSRYYSCETTKGIRVVPVFYVADMVFDHEHEGQPFYNEPGPALFFMGCDDGHKGLKFASREDALKWIDEQIICDYEMLLTTEADNYRAGRPTIPFCYHN